MVVQQSLGAEAGERLRRGNYERTGEHGAAGLIRVVKEMVARGLRQICLA
jgi:hypothetical protein